MRRLILLLLLSCMAGLAFGEAGAPLKIGLLEFRPADQMRAQWGPVAAYLEKRLHRPLVLEIYDHAGLYDAVNRRAVDVVITSPGHFVLLQQTAGLSAALVTVVSSDQGHVSSVVGGTIFTLAERGDITVLSDLAEMRIAAASAQALGGYQAQAFELAEAGIPLPTGERLIFTGLPQDKVVDLVLDGRADVGFVRAGVLESLAAEGRIDLARFKIINRQHLPALAEAVSTRLYPDWPVAVMPQIDRPLANTIAAALLSLPHGSLGPDAVHGFETPANYDGVQALLERLRLPPYDRVPEIAPADLWRRYASWLVSVGGLLLLLAGASVGLVLLYGRARRAARAVAHLNAALEDERRLFIGGPAVAFKWRAAEGWPVEYASPNIRAQFGYDAGQFTRGEITFPGIVHAEDLGRVAAEVQGHVAARVPFFEQEYRIRRADGQYRWVYDFTVVVRDRAGRPTHFHGHLTDITPRKEAEQRLHASEQAFRAVVEHTPDTIARYDRECRRIYLNPAMLALIGRPSGELLGTTPEHSSPLLAPERFIERVRQVLDTGREVAEETLVRTPQGELRWNHTRLVPESGPDGGVASVLVIGRDIQDLKSREQQFRTLTENSPDVIVRYDRECRRVYVNPRFEQVYGIRPEEALGKTPMEVLSVPPAVATEFTATLQRVLASGTPWQGDLTWETKGRPVCLFVRLVPELGPKGEVSGALAIWSDISERKAMEEALRESEREFRTLAENTPDNIIRYDPDGRRLYMNSAAARTLRVDQQVLLGQRPDETPRELRIMDPTPISRLLDQVVATAKPQELELAFHHAVDGLRVHNIRAVPERDAQGRITGVLTVGRDITEYKNAQAELERYREHLEELVAKRTHELAEARDAAEAASRAKSVFLANMSHELRTPLNAILGFSTIMRNSGGLPPDLQQYLDIINRSGEHLLALINDVLEMAKIEAGRVELEEVPFDLGGLVRDVTDMMELRAREKGLRLLIDQSSEFPRYIVGDEGHLRQVLINLVGNAVKFTREGGVTVRLGTRANQRSHLVIEVEDTGPGIAQADQQRIFQPFIQLGEHRDNKGTGLGLTITRQFVQMMGGAITLESAPGKGSLFRVDLPLTLASEQGLVQAGAVPQGKVIGLAPGQPEFRVLIVEDQLENQLLLGNLMESAGFRVKVVENGALGVEAFVHWRPHLIWMDRKMPVMDGLEATRRIRDLPGGREVKIVAVTASAFQEERAEMLDAGMDDFVRKPYRFAEIYECMEKQLGVRFVREEDQRQAPAVLLTPGMLEALPSATRAEMKASLERLDAQAIAAVIAQVHANHPEVAEVLTRLAESFDYQAILDALRKSGSDAA